MSDQDLPNPLSEDEPPAPSPRPPSSMAQWATASVALLALAVSVGSFLVSNKTASTTAEFQRRQLRPYVEVLSSTLLEPEEGYPAGIEVYFENSGQTPARNLGSECYMAVTDQPAMDGSEFMSAGSMTPLRASLAPHHQGSCFVPLRSIYSPQLLASLRSGGATLGVRVYITYSDDLGEQYSREFTAILGGSVGLPRTGRMAIAPGSGSELKSR